MMTRGERGQPHDHAIEGGERKARRQREREQREAGRRAHGSKVAEIDGQRAVADRVGRGEGRIEMHAFDEGIDAQHLEPIPSSVTRCLPMASRMSRLAPVCAAEITSAACTIIVSSDGQSMSMWCAAIAITTASLSPCFLSTSIPISRFVPCMSRSMALPM